MSAIIIRILLGVFATAVGIFAFVKVLKKHKKIDTESLAVVKEVQSLGRDDGRKVYAIRYDVLATEPFELLSTPCKKALRPGTERTVFYEKSNPNKNHYFKMVRQFDRRFIMPCAIIFCGIVIIASLIAQAF